MKRVCIDGLRAIAVLSVLFFHMKWSWFPGGYVGVDVFLVISGYLITTLILKEVEEQGSFRFGQFYLRRLRRLFPALAATVTATMLLGFLFLSPRMFAELGDSLVSALFSVSNVFFWLKADYFDTSSDLKPLLHTWSLSLEEQFYLLWPLTLVFLLKRNSVLWLWIGVGMLSLVSLCLAVFYADFIAYDSIAAILQEVLPKSTLARTADVQSTTFFGLPFRIFEFAIGASIAINGRRNSAKGLLANLGFIGGIFAIITSVYFFDENIIFPSYYALLPCFGAALIIYYGDKATWASFLRSKIAVKVGLMSYSLYLVHWPVIVFWRYVVEEFSLVDHLGILILSGLLTFVSFHFVEKPFRHRHEKILAMKPWIVGTAMLVLLTVLGIRVSNQSGWKWRIDSNQNLLAIKSNKHFHRDYYGGRNYPSYGPFKTNESADIILVGDSHGRHYAEGLWLELVKPLGLSLHLASGSSCLHLPDFRRSTFANPVCPEKLEKLKGMVNLSQKTKVPMVILSHSWTPQKEIAYVTTNGTERAATQDDIRQGILDLKKYLDPIELVVIGEVPGAGMVVYDYLTRPRFSRLLSDLRLDFQFHTPSRKTLEFNASLARAAESKNEFVFLNPTDILCTKAAKCRNLSQGGKILYSDRNHLSVYGSREVIAGFRLQLTSIVQKLDLQKL